MIAPLEPKKSMWNKECLCKCYNLKWSLLPPLDESQSDLTSPTSEGGASRGHTRTGGCNPRKYGHPRARSLATAHIPVYHCLVALPSPPYHLEAPLISPTSSSTTGNMSLVWMNIIHYYCSKRRRKVRRTDIAQFVIYFKYLLV